MKSISKKFTIILVVFVLFLTSTNAYGFLVEEDQIEKGLKYLENMQNDDGGFPSKEGRQSDVGTTSWVLMALAAAGEDIEDGKWTPENQNPADYILNSEIQLKETTDYGRLLMALTGAGRGSVYGDRDLADAIKSFQSQDGHFGQEKLGESTMINSHMWSVLALKSAGIQIPNKEKARQWLLSAQNDDGGYSWYIGGQSDSDDTAIAVQALIILGENPKSSSAVKKALEYIKTRQTSNGGFSSSDMMGSESNSASDSWIITGLRAAGQDPAAEDWTENNNSVIEHLSGLQSSDGSFKWQEDIQSQKVQMTAYAITALSGKSYPVNVDYEKVVESKSPFTDINKYHWAYDEILDMVGQEVINGYPDRTFRPEKKVTREEFTSMVIKALDMENLYYRPSLDFEDLDKESWSFKYISIAYRMSIINGRTKYIFDPKGEISGAELATMLVNTLKEEEKQGYPQGKEWYSKNVSIGQDKGLLYPGFKADEKASRAQCAYSIYKLMELKK